MKRIEISDGTIEALKWFALVAMILDHVNKYIFNYSLPIAYELGRVCMPIFGFVIAYKLARYATANNDVYKRVINRLFIYGAIATPAFVLLLGWWPLNILLMLALAVLCIRWIDIGGRKNVLFFVLAFLILGALVEFWWWGVGLVIVTWSFIRNPTVIKLASIFLVLASLSIINQNFYALLSIPIIHLSQFVNLRIPRFKTIFYAMYPIHLYIIYLAM